MAYDRCVCKRMKHLLINCLGTDMKETMNGNNIYRSNHALIVSHTMVITWLANDQVFNRNRPGIYRNRPAIFSDQMMCSIKLRVF